jgi:hypothetical protein
MNVKLLRKVQEAILLNSDAFNMHEYYQPQAEAPCGTAACIMGWAHVIHSGHQRPAEVSDDRPDSAVPRVFSDAGAFFASLDALDLDWEMRDRLFYTHSWPQEFEYAYHEAADVRNWEAAALVAAARIEHFIETNGRE